MKSSAPTDVPVFSARLSQSKAALGHAASANVLPARQCRLHLGPHVAGKVKPAFIFMPINQPASAGRAAR